MVTWRLDTLGMTQKAGDPGPDGFTALVCYNDYMASAAILHLVIDVGETFAATVAPLQAAGRWPRTRSR